MLVLPMYHAFSTLVNAAVTPASLIGAFMGRTPK